MPASPEIKTISRPSPAATRLKASVSNADSGSRPITPKTGAISRRGGGGIAIVRGIVVAQRLPADRQGLDRLGQALQVQGAQRGEDVRAAPAGHGPDEVRGQDLAALGAGTQAGRLDHRLAEVVVVLSRHLPGAETHAQTQGSLRTGVVAFDRLLHGHRARQGGRGDGEDDHEAVAQGLHLGAPRGRHGLAKGGEVRPPQLAAGVGGQRRGQLGRIDQVGEQHRDVLGGSHPPSSVPADPKIRRERRVPSVRTPR